MKILAIGNSFSDDATAYLSSLALSAGVELLVGNLYIGGCPLQLHAQNLNTDAAAYDYYLMQGDTKEHHPSWSARKALLSEPWDVVTLQQASHDSGRWESYQPYLSQVSAHVRELAPQAVQWIHQTWAYETDSTHGGFAHYGCDQNAMFQALRTAYAKAAQTLNAPVIPCGEAVQLARRTPLFDYANGGRSLCRDGFHISIPHGRYLLACVWFEALTGVSADEIKKIPLDEAGIITPEEAAVLRECARRAVMAYRE